MESGDFGDVRSWRLREDLDEPGNGGGAPGGRTRRDRERQRCRRNILRAASGLFARFGFQKTNMKSIADEADVSVGKLYSCFAGKDEVFHELLHHYFVEQRQRGDAAARMTDEPLEQLRCRIRAVVQHFKEHLDFLMIYHNENPLILEGHVRAEIDRYAETAAKLLAEAMDRGDIPREDPRVLAAMMVGCIRELLQTFASGGSADAFDEVPGIIDRIIIKPLELRQETDSGMEGR
jgi:TetR/AcrR family transcriptional regulator